MSGQSLRTLLLVGLSFTLLGAVAVAGHRTPAALAAAPRHARGIYPDRAKNLTSMRDRSDQPAMRAHAWAILADLTKGASSPHYDPIWDGSDWKNKCSLGLAPGRIQCGASEPSAAVIRKSCPPPDEPESLTLNKPVQHTGDSSAAAAMSSVLFNASAAGFIRQRCLNTLDGLTRLNADEAGQGAANPANQFPTDSIVVKLIWEMPDSETHQIGAWDPAMVVRGDPAAEILLRKPGDAHTLWHSAVQVNLDETVPCPAKTSAFKFAGASDFNPATDTVPVNCFYHKLVDCDQLRAGVGEVLGQRQSCAGDQTKLTAILVGVHVITAELPDWVWSTFWWTNQPDADPLQADRPDSIKKRGPWRFYSMNTTMSATTPSDPVDHGAKIIFNPYLEGSQANGPVSNCMYCHRMAVSRGGLQPDMAHEIAAGHLRRCAYLSPQPLPQNCMDALQQDSSPDPAIFPNDAYFLNAVPTHFLWSLAVAQDDVQVEATPMSFHPKLLQGTNLNRLD